MSDCQQVKQSNGKISTLAAVWVSIRRQSRLNAIAWGLLVVGLFGLSACEVGPPDIRDYYFPLKVLTEGEVYEYRAVDNSQLAPAYWYYRSFIMPEKIILTGTYYEYNFEPLQFVQEELVRNGMLLDTIFLYETDSAGLQQQVPGEILSGSVFPFEVKDTTTVFLYKVRFQFPSTPNQQITLIKNRRFAGRTTYTYKDKTYDCVKFDVKELVEVTDTVQGGMEPELAGYELYAEGVGLVYYEKEISPGQTLAYELYDQYPMTVLEEKFRGYLNQQQQNTTAE
ncbi:MAG: hypothetical protein AAF798_07315 [Bacteroidota bacterium]